MCAADQVKIQDAGALDHRESKTRAEPRAREGGPTLKDVLEEARSDSDTDACKSSWEQGRFPSRCIGTC